MVPMHSRLTVRGPSSVVSMRVAYPSPTSASLAPVQRICVYAGSNPGRDPAYAETAADLGRLLAGRGIGVVYGGGKVGLMGILADAAMEAGGEVIGVMPQDLVNREIGHPGITELRVVGSMHERKAMMAELSDGFIALPGGAGTLEELIEIYTWSQLGLHRNPMGVLNVNGYYDGLAGAVRPCRGRGLHPAAAPRGAALRRHARRPAGPVRRLGAHLPLEMDGAQCLS